MSMSIIVLIFLRAGSQTTQEEMDKANQEGLTFGSEQHEKDNITEAKKYGNEVLSQPHSTTPDTATPKELTDMQIERRKEQTKALREMEGDQLVKRLREQGSAHINNTKGTLDISFDSNNATEEVVDCIEPSDKPTYTFLTYERQLHLKIFHQDEIKKKRCTRKIKRCTNGWFFGICHSDDDSRCGSYKWIYPGATQDIETYQDCKSVTGWPYSDDDIVTVQHEKTECTSKEWQVHDPFNLMARVKNNECSLVKVEVIRGKDEDCYRGNNTDYHYGKAFQEDMWHQRMTVMCPDIVTKSSNPCLELRKKGCQELSSRPIQIPIVPHSPSKRTKDGFAKRYRCPVHRKDSVNAGTNNIHCIDGGNLVQAYKKYDDMAEALTYLSALSEMQKEVKDWEKAEIFKGTKNCCKKNVLDTVLYDCCMTKAGWAISLGFTACDANERALATRKEEGKCHYVGWYPNQFLAWKSSETHVYCCFESKLMAVLQKEARKQLGKNFGTPQVPDCKGLTIEEISRLNFLAMDLSEIFDDMITAVNKKSAQKIDTTGLQASMQAKFKILEKEHAKEEEKRKAAAEVHA